MKYQKETESRKDTGSPLNNEKQELRRIMLEKRNIITRDKVHAASDAIVAAIKSLPILGKAGMIMSYMPYGNEVDLMALNEWILEQGRKLCLPRVLNGFEMDAATVENLSQGLVKSRFGILEPARELEPVEPSRIDLILVPGVAFDRNGNRLGHGKGYYDRFLPNISEKAYTLGVAYGFQVLDHIPFNEYDKMLNGIVTENDFYNCTNRE